VTTPVRHFLLDRRAGFRAEAMLADAVEWGDRGIRLQPLPGSPQPLLDASGTFGGLSDPVGVAAGGDGTIVILDRAGDRVLRYDPCDQSFAPLPCLAPGWAAPRGAKDLAVTRPGDVVVADTGNRRVLVLVGAGLAVRRIVGPWRVEDGRVCPAVSSAQVPASGACPSTTTWPRGTWEPWGVTATCDGFAVTDHANGLVHRFDPCGRWTGATDGSGPHDAPLVRPTAIAADVEGNVYVLEEHATSVRVLDRDGAFVADLDSLNDRRELFCPIAVAVGPRGELCLAGAGGSVCVTSAGEPLGTVAVGDEVRGLAFDHDGNPVVVDGGRCCVVRLLDAAGYSRDGRFVTVALDSGLANCQWHRVALTARIPSGTSVRVDTLCAEAPLTPAELSALPDTRWASGQVAGGTDDAGRWDCLVHSAPGRYLWLALALGGDGVVTPEIDDVEVWFPRRTSLEYLPRAFRADPDSTDFLERFLSIFDAERGTVTSELDRVAALFDPVAVPASENGRHDFLNWLAHWVGMAADEQLPVARRRRLVKEATELYRVRGTPEGVRRHVSLFCGVEVRVLEHFKLRRWAVAGRGRLGDATQLFGPAIVRRLQLDEFSEVGSFRLVDTDDPLRDPFHVYAHRFSLLLLACADDRLLARARRVADEAKPAHTEVDVGFVEPRLRVGSQSSVGLDTVVGAVPATGRAGESRLGQALVVGPDPRFAGRSLAQIGTRARIGVDTGLE
jgi:phage tail-like protein